jgi:hypothetical protein
MKELHRQRAAGGEAKRSILSLSLSFSAGKSPSSLYQTISPDPKSNSRQFLFSSGIPIQI